MKFYDYLLLIVSVLLVVIIVLQGSKDDASKAFSGEKSELFANQKQRPKSTEVLKKIWNNYKFPFFIVKKVRNIFQKSWKCDKILWYLEIFVKKWQIKKGNKRVTYNNYKWGVIFYGLS